jgi:DNA-binding MarR family transcriptional regulator
MDTPAESRPPEIAVELAETLRAFVGTLKRQLREQADVGDLKPSQIAVLLHLEKHGAATTSSLARAVSMRPQSMGPIIVALQAGGMVAGAPDPADGRQTLLSLTDPCRQWMAQGRAARQDWLSRTIGTRLSADEQDQLVAAMPLLLRLVAE